MEEIPKKYHKVRLSVYEIRRRWPPKFAQLIYPGFNDDAAMAAGWNVMGLATDFNVQKVIECVAPCKFCTGEQLADDTA